MRYHHDASNCRSPFTETLTILTLRPITHILYIHTVDGKLARVPPEVGHPPNTNGEPLSAR